jgi:hypothetical protein
MLSVSLSADAQHLLKKLYKNKEKRSDRNSHTWAPLKAADTEKQSERK